MSFDRRAGRALLVLLSVAFVAFELYNVRRLNNNVLGDMEFTGWTAPFAARLTAGERPYEDFVMPLPPGSFIVLAAIQKLMGRRLLLQELGLIAVSHLLMGLLAYAIAVRLTTRLNAVLAAFGTLVLVVQMPKECAYDHTAQLSAWASLALGVRALLEEPPRRARFWVATGLAAGLTFLFKQSTAVGIVGGWIVGFGYLALARRLSDRAQLSALGRDARLFAIGLAAGVVATLSIVLATGATLGGYFEAVFVDGPKLKGGALTLLENLGRYVFVQETFPGGLFLTAAVIGIGMRIVRFDRALHLGDDSRERPSFDLRSMLFVALLIVAVYGTSVALFIREVRALPQFVVTTSLELRKVPMFGLFLGCAYFIGHLFPKAATSAETIARGHVLNALFLVALSSSLLHGLSFVQFYPFYNNDAVIPFAFVYLIAAADHARLPGLKALVITLSVLSVFNLKLSRALSADLSVVHGNWSGLRVNYRGKEMLDAATRVRQLAGPSETVLVLPEDPELVALIARPRPKLKGAIVFVDQYPKRLAEGDIKELERAPPKVIVIHPRQRAQWRHLYWTWGKNSGAEQVLVHVLDHMLDRYRRDSTFRSIFFWDQGQLDVYVRADEPRVAAR